MGNAAFNEGDIQRAAKIFKAVQYQDGLIRLGDYYYFDKRQPLIAYGYYKQARHSKMIQKLTDGFVFALKCWVNPDQAGQLSHTSQDVSDASSDTNQDLEQTKQNEQNQNIDSKTRKVKNLTPVPDRVKPLGDSYPRRPIR